MMATDQSFSTVSAFRSRATFMKTWRPESLPSNRDRLELYALHMQSTRGDAPNDIISNSVVERSKYQAWRSKQGMALEAAMMAYITESDRQIRVYGSGRGIANPQTPQSTTTTPNNSNTNPSLDSAPRGIAAVPLLSAAAAESRDSYVRRMERTTLESAWWTRQEPLCGTPGTITCLPELFLLAIASLMEYLSLRTTSVTPIPAGVVHSFFWPLHNACLSIWTFLIVVFTTASGGVSLLTTLFWGSRRTGLSLPKIWNDTLTPVSQLIHVLCQSRQPISVRLVGLLLLPFCTIVQGICLQYIEPVAGHIATSAAFCFCFFFLTWWYWFLLAPWVCACFLGASFMSGFCFAVIEFAGV